MIDPHLPEKVNGAAKAAARRARSLDLAAWWQRIEAAGRSNLLPERLAQAREHRWAGAIPTWEPVGLAKSVNCYPVDVVGIDGSQVYPPERSPFLWAYVQALAYRAGFAPLLESRFVDIGQEIAEGGQLAGELYEHQSELVALTDAWRALLEIQMARRASGQHPGVVVLLDGGLLPWLSVSGRVGQKHLRTYLNDLLAMQPAKIAGLVSGPQSRLLSRLVRLVEGETLEEALQEGEGVNDLTLMRYRLADGQRSALFLHASPRNDLFAEKGAAVYFFFLRLKDQEVARVEVPQWVAQDPACLDSVQATILRDSQATGYPYCLAQAHNQVTVPGEVVKVIQSGGLSCYWAEFRQVLREPAKAAMKQAARSADEAQHP